LKKVQPRDIEALSAVNAFIRPGSSGLDEYVAGKFDETKIRKLDPRLDRHLATTYGAIVYQEQIMFLISELMGISFGQADLYRRALEKPAKDKKGYVKKFNETVVDVAVSRGFNREVADLVRQLIIDNSGYGFNKSHSIAYSIISYWTAYLKANFPLIFYTTMFNGSIDQLADFMAEAKKLNISIRPPHVCYSNFNSSIEDEENSIIRIGFNAVKGIGPKAVESILEFQPYVSIDDFFERNQLRTVNKKVIEAIINANAFEGLGIKIEENDIPENVRQFFNIKTIDNKKFVVLSRTQMTYWYEKVGEAAGNKTAANYLIPASMIKSKYLDQFVLEAEKEGGYVIPEDRLEDMGIKFNPAIEPLKTRKKPKGEFKDSQPKVKIPPFRKPFITDNFAISQIKENYLEMYLKETEELGFSFLSHPLEHLIDKMTPYDVTEDGYSIITAGIIIELIQRQTKTNRKYYWVIIQTPRERVRITLWDNQYKAYANVIQKYKLIKVTGIKGYGGMSCESLSELRPKN
jgi:DNA polymerase III alpha subunit